MVGVLVLFLSERAFRMWGICTRCWVQIDCTEMLRCQQVYIGSNHLSLMLSAVFQRSFLNQASLMSIVNTMTGLIKATGILCGRGGGDNAPGGEI